MAGFYWQIHNFIILFRQFFHQRNHFIEAIQRRVNRGGGRHIHACAFQ